MVEPYIMGDQAKGHRQRLKDRFINGDSDAYHEETLLELLLTYSIPQQDVQPLAKSLLATFGSFTGVLEANSADLCRVDGLKTHTAVLLKLTHWIGTHTLAHLSDSHATYNAALTNQQESPFSDGDTHAATLTAGRLSEPTTSASDSSAKASESAASPEKTGTSRPTLFGKALMKDAIAVLPQLYEIESLDQARARIRSLLHYSSEGTRQRFASYIVRRIFPDGHIDRALPDLARAYLGCQELRDVCFYLFCRAEPLMYELVRELFLPSIGRGRLQRQEIRQYLAYRFPTAAEKTVGSGAGEVIQTFKDAGLARSDRQSVTYAYRDIRLTAFAFVLHSEFPTPGMYDIAELEQNKAVRSMLWNPEWFLSALYELRNQGLISKVSEIDAVRQFTTRLTREEAINALAQKILS